MPISGIEALSLLADKLSIAGTFWIAVGGLNHNMESLGFFVIGSFAACWIVSALIYRWKQYDVYKPESAN